MTKQINFLKESETHSLLDIVLFKDIVGLRHQEKVNPSLHSLFE